MRIIFMGTPDFAVPSLKVLVENGYDVCLVVTQPDKPKGRGNKVAMSPVKEAALSYGIEIFQPEKVKNNEFTEKLISCKADLIVTVAYGKILSESALKAATLGCINVHASLLPEYRGAAPLWRVIINGEKKTGITTMFTDIGMDTGDIIDIAEYDIDDDLTVGELSEAMSLLGAETLTGTLIKLKNGTITRRKQDDSQATYAPMIEKNTGHINWDSLAREIHNLVRGTNPWPVAYTYYEDRRMRIYATRVIESGNPEEMTPGIVPGTILKVSDEGILVSAADGRILIKEVQFDSSKRMPVKEYIKGHEIKEGTILKPASGVV